MSCGLTDVYFVKVDDIGNISWNYQLAFDGCLPEPLNEEFLVYVELETQDSNV